MKRDLNLVREILKWAAEQNDAKINANPIIEGYSEEQIYYHIHIMAQAGLVFAAESKVMSRNPQVILVSITWAGQDFLDAANSDSLWKKAMNTVLKEGQSFTFEYVKDWLRQNIPDASLIPPFS